jgi:hypothetical protein
VLCVLSVCVCLVCVSFVCESFVVCEFLGVCFVSVWALPPARLQKRNWGSVISRKVAGVTVTYELSTAL